MSLEFEFSRFKDANKFGKNLSRNLKVTTVHEQRNNKHVVVIPEKNLNKIAASALAISIVSAGLINGQQYLDEEKFNLVLEAMQRANPNLANLSEPEIGEYLSNLSPEQMQGIISNTKGVYHELSYVGTYNNLDLDAEASLHPELTNPGSDILFTKEGEVVNEVQLKATDSSSYVNEHLEKYPEVDVLATEEVANKVQGVESSGFSNTDLENDVVTSIEELESMFASETVSATVSDEITGLGPISIITGLLFGIF